MNVALIGNMNNNFFNFVRYLRDRGINADVLLIDNEFDHFSPTCDTFEKVNTDYVVQLTWGEGRSFLHTSAKVIEKDLNKYDFIIGCGYAPAFLEKIGKKLDIFIPYGGDLYGLPFAQSFNNYGDDFSFFQLLKNYKQIIRDFIYVRLRRNQRKGIRNASLISFPEFPQSLEWFDLLGVRNNFELGCPMIYDREYLTIEKNYSRSKWYGKFKKIRQENELVVFHHSRHVWNSRPEHPANKGNHILIKGFAMFLKEHPDVNACLVLFEYGPDVGAGKALIHELEIENRVKWFPILPRKEVMIGLSQSDIGATTFHFGEYGGGAEWEILLAGKPLLAFLDKKQAVGPKRKYPLINVIPQPDAVAVALEQCNADKARMIKTGENGRNWLLENFSNSTGAIVELIHQKERGNSVREVVNGWKTERKAQSFRELGFS
jgi:glycosyltransferase involved in cell wall biosynthesis